MNLKQLIHRFLINSKPGLFISNLDFKRKFRTSSNYWEQRYAQNGNSGIGSYGMLASYKSEVLNQFITKTNILKVIELGCGDGNQLEQFKFLSYIGLDISLTALEKCITRFKNDDTKSFFLYHPKGFVDHLKIFNADLSLSLDVIYHLIEDDIFEMYMYHLFSVSYRYVIIYAWDVEGVKRKHIRHRKFTNWVENNEKSWQLIEVIENKKLQGSCNFFIYEKLK